MLEWSANGPMTPGRCCGKLTDVSPALGAIGRHGSRTLSDIVQVRGSGCCDVCDTGGDRRRVVAGTDKHGHAGYARGGSGLEFGLDRRNRYALPATPSESMLVAVGRGARRLGGDSRREQQCENHDDSAEGFHRATIRSAE